MVLSKKGKVSSLDQPAPKNHKNPRKAPYGLLGFVSVVCVCGFLLTTTSVTSGIRQQRIWSFSPNLSYLSLESDEPADRALDVVVSFYKPDPRSYGTLPLASILQIPAINESRPMWYLYNKGPAPPPLFTNVKIDHVINITNVGREGHSFLHHIVHNYHNLSRQTIFCQENPDKIWNVLFQLEHYYDQTTGFMSLSDGMRCTCDGCSGYQKRLKEFYAILTQKLCIHDFTASLHGCFVVSRQRIRHLPLERYQYMLDLMEAPSDHDIHSESCLHAINLTEKSRPERPCFGYTLERTWSVMFNCSGLDVLERRACPNRTCVGPQCIDENTYPVHIDLARPRSWGVFFKRTL